MWDPGPVPFKICIWPIDTSTKQIFPVKIECDEVWGSVKDEKKRIELNDFDADTLDLWKVPLVYPQLPIQKVIPNKSEDLLKTFTATNHFLTIDVDVSEMISKRLVL
jgi:hypothetical protein